MASQKGSQGPETVAAGLGNVLREIVSTMQAPDATNFAGPLMKLQTDVLGMIHGQMQGGGQAPGAPAQGGPPPGGGGGSPLMGGIAGMQGGGAPPPPTTSGVDGEQIRQDALMGAGQ